LHVERSVLDPRMLGVMRDELMHQNSYHDPAIPGWAYRGRVDAAPYSTLYMDAHALFASDTFLAICANPAIMGFCRDAGAARGAQLGMGVDHQSGPSRIAPVEMAPQQRRAVQCAAGAGAARCGDHARPWAHDGDPGIIAMAECFEPRLYAEEEMADLQARLPADMVLAEVGDAAFINPFALHRMMPPHRRQRMLMLLASIGPSHRSPRSAAAVWPICLESCARRWRTTGGFSTGWCARGSGLGDVRGGLPPEPQPVRLPEPKPSDRVER
jgi:hypothetical protein